MQRVNLRMDRPALAVMTNRLTIDMRMLHASGIGTYISNLVPCLISQCPSLEFCLLGNIDDMKDVVGEGHRNVSFTRCLAPIYSIREQIEIPRLIPPETTLFWSPHFNIPLRYRGKMMVTVHDLFHLAMPQFVKGFGKRTYAKTLFRAILRKSSVVLFDSRFTRSEFHRLVGSPRSESEVINCGIDPVWFEPGRSARPHNRPYILYAGNLKPHKNIARLLKVYLDGALAGDLDFVIIGKRDGFISGDDEAKQLAANQPDRIHFTGYVDSQTLRDYFSHASCLVFPSLYEGFGLPPVEAMAAGCPALVSNRASIPEICGDAALYCDPEDDSDMAKKLELILTDNDLRSRLISNGKARAARYSWDKSAEQLKELILPQLR